MTRSCTERPDLSPRPTPLGRAAIFGLISRSEHSDANAPVNGSKAPLGGLKRGERRLLQNVNGFGMISPTFPYRWNISASIYFWPGQHFCALSSMFLISTSSRYGNTSEGNLLSSLHYCILYDNICFACGHLLRSSLFSGSLLGRICISVSPRFFEVVVGKETEL